ncbi:MAG: adenosylcobinamide-GDP ribazoletransferase, partial [Pseudomonadota bacterium]
SASLAVVTLLVVTGALHEDGLADCADGFWGGGTTERRLDIMRDSRIGTYGVLALISAVLLKVAVMQSAIAAGPLFGALTLVAAAVAARAVALYAWVGLPPARTDGLAVGIGRPTIASFRSAVLVAIAMTALLVAWWAPIGFIVAALAAAVAAKTCASIAERKIGGHTGDVIGASVVTSDLLYALALTMWTA